MKYLITILLLLCSCATIPTSEIRKIDNQPYTVNRVMVFGLIPVGEELKPLPKLPYRQPAVHG